MPASGCRSDTMSANFDNIADEQALSPTLLESYLNAAADISRMAVGDKTAPSIDHTYTNPTYMSQHPWDRVAGAPFGTRGGMVVNHVFPADGEYQFEMTFNSGENTRFEDIDISIDGERVALVAYELINIAGADGRGQTPLRTEPILVKAGQHKVAAAFVKKIDGPYEDLIRPHDWSYAGGGSGGARHHHAAAHGRPRHPRTDQDHRHLDDGEPPEDLHLPSDLVGRTSASARSRSSRRSAAKRIAGR